MEHDSKKKSGLSNLVHTMLGDHSSDSGKSMVTVQLSPKIESEHSFQTTALSKINAVMKIKGGAEIDFQVDTGTTCNVRPY